MARKKPVIVTEVSFRVREDQVKKLFRDLDRLGWSLHSEKTGEDISISEGMVFTPTEPPAAQEEV